MPERPIVIETLLHQAETALTLARQQGGDRVCIFREG
jgi:PleD family two-component response regulator